jgi:hypothetical protein
MPTDSLYLDMQNCIFCILLVVIIIEINYLIIRKTLVLKLYRGKKCFKIQGLRTLYGSYTI